MDWGQESVIHVSCDVCGFDRYTYGGSLDEHILELLRFQDDVHDAEPGRTRRLRVKAERDETLRASRQIHQALKRIPPDSQGGGPAASAPAIATAAARSESITGCP